MRFHPRHVGVAEQGDPVGRQREHLADGLPDAVLRLPRQAVDQVDVDLAYTRRPQARDDVVGLFEGLFAIDCFLHPVIEILHADAGACDACVCKSVNLVARHPARIDLNAEFGFVMDSELGADARRQFADVLWCQDGRRAAAPVDGPHHCIGCNMPGDGRHLGLENRQIARHRLIAFRVLGVAPAEPAQSVAVGNVKVQRQRIAGVNRPQPFPIGFAVDPLMKVRRRRIAGVARQRLCVLLDEGVLRLHRAVLAQKSGWAGARGRSRLPSETGSERAGSSVVEGSAGPSPPA